jgi:hypothetical protein
VNSQLVVSIVIAFGATFVDGDVSVSGPGTVIADIAL